MSWLNFNFETKLLSLYWKAILEYWFLIPSMFCIGLLIGTGYLYLNDKQDDSHVTIKRYTSISFLGLSIIGGLYLAFDHASIVDDAFISFRYIHNLLEGNGLVFNPGEHVEGYTNFLWTILIAIFALILPLEIPFIAFCLNILCYIINLLIIYKLGKFLFSKSNRFYLPIAVILCAFQMTFVSWATGGLETMFTSLLVNAGLLFLLKETNNKSSLLAGSFLIAAVLSRPDHCIFYLAGAVTILIGVSPELREHFDKNKIKRILITTLKPLYFYSLPFLAYLLYLGWKIYYYGSIVPNTYYAKSANLSWFGQGWVYMGLFFASSHFWLILLVFIIWLFIKTENRQITFKRFVAMGCLAYMFYVLKIGGDFMFGRFYLTLIPLMLLGVEQCVLHVLDKATSSAGFREKLSAILLVAVIFSTIYGTRIIESGAKWGIADERTYYPVTSLWPITINNSAFTTGKFLKKNLTDLGFHPTIASSAHGMNGYYSQLELIDMRGLTDAVVAKIPLKRRYRPGHEKWPTREYLLERNVRFLRWNPHPKRFAELTAVYNKKKQIHGWHTLIYDKKLMDTIAKSSSRLKVKNFEEYLDDYLLNAYTKDTDQIADDFEWFKTYYFNHNRDESRFNQFKEMLAIN